jgi:hypothetical protein
MKLGSDPVRVLVSWQVGMSGSRVHNSSEAPLEMLTDLSLFCVTLLAFSALIE